MDQFFNMNLFWMGLVISFCIASSVLHWQQKRRGARLPPGPFAWPILGNMHFLMTGAPAQRVFQKLADRYGPILYVRLGSIPTVIVSSPELAKEILATHDKVFSTRPHLEAAHRLTYGQDTGLAMRTYSPGWREMRRLYATQLITANRMKEFKPIIMEEIKKTVGEITCAAETRAAYDITKGLGRMVDNIMCRILMGKRLDEVSSNLGVGKNLKQLFHEGSVLFANPIIGEFIPCLSFVDRKLLRRMHAWHVALDEILESVITKRESILAASESLHEDPKSFLDVLLSKHLPRDEVKQTMTEALSAGIDTSSVAIDWAMAELLLNPKAMTKMEEELGGLTGFSQRRIIEEEDLPHLVYTKAVVKEALRLHTPVPLLLPHMAMEACQVGGYSLPKGTRLLVNVWAIARDPKVWAYADTFWPDRFLGECEQVDVRGNHYELLPFGSGRRICAGMPFALRLVETTLANLIHAVRWSLPPPPNHIVDMSDKLGSVLARTRPLVAIPSPRTQNLIS